LQPERERVANIEQLAVQWCAVGCGVGLVEEAIEAVGRVGQEGSIAVAGASVVGDSVVLRGMSGWLGTSRLGIQK
jgi:hypothetical protein